MNRQHQHNLNGDRPVWVDCLTLDHCPSVCDCRPGEPCAQPTDDR